MFYHLFLDDERSPYKVTWVNLPPGPWEVVKSYGEFVAKIKALGIPVFVSFDHDLCLEHYRASMFAADKHYNQYYTDGTFKEKTGYHCAQFLVEECIQQKVALPEYAVHTMNPVGKENIVSVMESGRKILAQLLS